MILYVYVRKLKIEWYEGCPKSNATFPLSTIHLVAGGFWRHISALRTFDSSPPRS